MHAVHSSTLLAGGIAHELNNALAPILLAATMLDRRLEDPGASKLLAMIEKSARKARC